MYESSTRLPFQPDYLGNVRVQMAINAPVAEITPPATGGGGVVLHRPAQPATQDRERLVISFSWRVITDRLFFFTAMTRSRHVPAEPSRDIAIPSGMLRIRMSLSATMQGC